jgi:hypothetical protein
MSAPILLILFISFAAAAIYLAERLRCTKAELADMTDDRDIKAHRAANAERVMQGLQDDLTGRIETTNTATRELDFALRRMSTAEADADRLAPFVANFIADMDVIAKKLGTIDEKPLDLSCEREAIRLHEEAVKLRIK